MKISALSQQDESRFNELALRDGTIFNTIEWTNIFNNYINRYGIYNDNNELIGGFIIFVEKKFGFSIYRNPPFTPEIGPFLKIDAQNPVSILGTWKKALSLMTDLIEASRSLVISLSLSQKVIDVQPFLWKDFKATPEYTYLLDLTLPLEVTWKRMSSERRKNIIKGTKDQLQVVKITDFEIVQALVIKTCLRQKIKINESYLNKILYNFANQRNSFAFATFANNSPIACSFCIHDNNMAYYLLGGFDSDCKHHGAGTLSLWEAIKHAKCLGLKCFDFEGSMIPQIERYFRGFGGRLVPYYRINKANLPVEIMLKFFKRRFF